MDDSERVPVVAAQRFELAGELHSIGDALEVAPAVADRLIAAGLAERREHARASSLESRPVLLAVDGAVPVQPQTPTTPAPDPISLGEAVARNGALKPKPPPVRKRKAMSVCSTPGCPELVPQGKCPGCRRKADAGRDRSVRRPYQRANWQRTRADFLADHPYCECEDHAAVPAVMRPPATDVHHRDGLGPLGPRGHDHSNLQSLTHECHSRITSREQSGNWGRHGA